MESKETKRFGPYKLSDSDKRMSQHDKSDLSTKSTLSPYSNPYNSGTLTLDHRASSILNTLVKRSLRAPITKILETKQGKSFAYHNWEGIFDMIIQTHLATHDPNKWGKSLTPEQIENFKVKYPDQLKFLSEIQSMIDEGKTIDQISTEKQL